MFPKKYVNLAHDKGYISNHQDKDGLFNNGVRTIIFGKV